MLHCAFCLSFDWVFNLTFSKFLRFLFSATSLLKFSFLFHVIFLYTFNFEILWKVWEAIYGNSEQVWIGDLLAILAHLLEIFIWSYFSELRFLFDLNNTCASSLPIVFLQIYNFNHDHLLHYYTHTGLAEANFGGSGV